MSLLRQDDFKSGNYVEWGYFTFRDSDRDIAAWREKKYAKAVILFVLDNFVKVAVMAFLFPFVALYFFTKLFSD